VLARGQIYADPPHGGTVRVLLDSAFMGTTPQAWVSRPDLLALFPESEYAGVRNALGVWTMDTTALSNGVHSIAWVVTGTNGETDGIGSRFFSVANSTGGSSTAGVAQTPVAALAATPVPAAGTAAVPAPLLVPLAVAPPDVQAAVAAAPLETSPLPARTGADPDAPFVSAPPSDGRDVFEIEEMDRVELQLGWVGSDGDVTGYLRSGAELSPLPIGSHLDRSAATFAWLPGPGFVRDYDLVFVRWSGGVAVARRDVRIVILPKVGGR
jgi:hypothetical protein